MKTDELMRGDLLLHKGQPIKVEEILIDGINPMWDGSESYGNEAYYEGLQPIPLTSEILEKNGFEKEDVEYWNIGKNPYGSSMYLNEVSYGYIICVKNFGIDEYVYLYDCNYVHKLQHLLKDLGIEKEFVL